jgi:hypothetical protein
MKRIIVFLFFTLLSSVVHSQESQWQLVHEKGVGFLKKDLQLRNDQPKEFEIYKLHLKDFRTEIINTSKNTLEIPTSNGVQTFAIKEASILAPALAKAFPSIKSYEAVQLHNKSITAKLSFGIDGLHIAVYEPGETTFYVDPYTKDNKYFIVYKRGDLQKEANDFECKVLDFNSSTKKNDFQEKSVNNGLLRTYRLALVCTGEYAQFHLTRLGVSTAATDSEKKAAVLSAMNTTINRVNGVFERDLSVSFEIVADNEKIVFLDSDTDELSNTDANLLIDESQVKCDTVIGDANYDLGHTFSTGAGGLAGRGVVCITGLKASGVTGTGSPFGVTYDIDFVAHEIGHQFGANHTFNGTAGSCSGGNRNNATAVEPGSGNTIMAYAGICAPQNVKNWSDDHFHSVSISEMRLNIQTSGNCAATTETGNTAPEADAGSDYSIPKSTPFILRGVGTDVDAGDLLTYNWEQIDSEVDGAIPPISSNTGGAMFKSFPSSTFSDRYMPTLATVVAGNISAAWEVVPSVARELNFSLLVRDNHAGGGNTGRDDMTVTTIDAAPFLISAPNAAIIWNTGSSQTITWDVGATNIAPINCERVHIKLSTDGGITFPVMLAEGTINDGSFTFTVPENPTNTARIMVEAADNIFYDVSNANFTINSTVPTFVMSDISGNQEVCNGSNTSASFVVGMNFVNNFSETVSFSAANQPSSAVVSFSPVNINSDGEVTMQISNLDGVAAQDYTIIITGTSASITQNLEVLLHVYTNSFSVLTLSSPANNATDVSLTPMFVFNEQENASSYLFEIATDRSFSSMLYSSNTTLTSYFIPVTLDDLTSYFWRVKPMNNCGEGVFSSVFKFTTEQCVLCSSNGNESYQTSTTLVQFNTIDHSTIKSSGYSSYTDTQSTSVKREDTYDLTIHVNTDDGDTEEYTVQTIVWIDWNQNCRFNDEGEEYDLGSATGTPNGPTSLSPIEILIPSGAALGNTIMRVNSKYASDGIQNSCELGFDGEVEDYGIMVEEAVASIEDCPFEQCYLFPNPTKGAFTLNFKVITSDKAVIQLFDIQGRLVGEKKYTSLNSVFKEKIYFDNTSPGLYLLKISNGHLQTTRKLLIE